MTPEEEKVLCSTTLYTCNEVRTVIKNNQDEFFSWCSKNKVYEIWTREYIDQLCFYLGRRLFELGIRYKGVNILECGAGNGLLTHHINKWFNDKTSVAVDDNSWGIDPIAPVINKGIKEALLFYQPLIILHSWMPYGIDFTNIYRECKVCQEYILIGEAYGGCCGHEEQTWNEDEYKKDGFVLAELDFNAHQLCRTDYPAFNKHSYTMAFRRRTEEA